MVFFYLGTNDGAQGQEDIAKEKDNVSNKECDDD
jgi:hypothetical protein